MNKKSVSLVILISGILTLFIAAGIYAGTDVADVIKMENPKYKEARKKGHSKGIVEFTHKKHNVDYGIACGECHHDDAGKPLDLKMGDDVQGCGTCHSEFGKLAKADKKMKKADKIKKYHEKAIHANCIDCHKKKENKAKKAPSKCKDCHPKKKK